MYMHQKKCTMSCPDGYYGDRGGASPAADGTTIHHTGTFSADLLAASQTPWTCKPCVAGCTKCHDAVNCVDCSATCSVPGTTPGGGGGEGGKRGRRAAASKFNDTASIGTQQQCAPTCIFTLPPLPPPLGPGGTSGGPGSGTPIWPTVNVKFNVTIPEKGNVTAGNSTYTSLDACGLNVTHNTKTLAVPLGPDGDGSEQLWCSRWSTMRHQWVREGCSVEHIYQSVVEANTTTNASSMSTTVTCNCAVVIPPTKQLSFAGGGLEVLGDNALPII